MLGVMAAIDGLITRVLGAIPLPIRRALVVAFAGWLIYNAVTGRTIGPLKMAL